MSKLIKTNHRALRTVLVVLGVFAAVVALGLTAAQSANNADSGSVVNQGFESHMLPSITDSLFGNEPAVQPQPESLFPSIKGSLLQN